jgi:carboxyl-terminal processing protease
MSKLKWSGLLAAFILALVPVFSVQAEEAPASHPYVVLVGIDQYADKQIKPRKHAEADAQALFDLFTDKGYLGVQPDHVKLLLGNEDRERKSEPATHENIIKAVQWMAAHAEVNDLVVFAYLGEGGPLTETGGSLCYFASDTTLKNRAKNAVAAADIGQELDKLKSQKFVALIDVNFHGYNDGPEKLGEPTLAESPYEEFRGTDGKHEKGPAPGRIVFLANSGMSASLDLEKHGLFTQVLLDGLKGAADKEGYEPDSLVTVEELAEYVDSELPALGRKAGKTDQEKRQLPHVLPSRGCHFVFTRNPAVSAKVTERLQKLAELEKEKKITRELAAEGRKLLARMPKFKAYQDLRKEYVSLVEGKLSGADLGKHRDEILAALQMKHTEAMTFAAKVIQSTEIIREGYVKEVNQGDMVGWAVNGLYRQIDEKVPADIRERLEKAKGMSEKDLTNLLADVRQRLGQREDLANHKDLDVSLQRMLQHLDPYTTYIDPDMLGRFTGETEGRFKGVGIQIHADVDKEGLRVVTPIKGSPAYSAGIKTDDLITKIIREVDAEGEPLSKPDIVSTKGMSSDDAVKKIKGKPGTKVKLVIQRDGVDHPLEFELTRSVVEVETVLGINRKANDEWNFYVDPASKICYVRLTSFARNTLRDLKHAVNKLSKQGINGFILDLRFNPGGLLTSATDISDIFIDDGVIVTIRPRIGKEQIYRGVHEGSYVNFPMVCLVNGLSASGSEIVSACLQDHERAIIMGERSYGKGSVQNIQPFEGGQLKLTTASFWRPSNKNLNKSSTSGKEDDTWGVTPNRGYTIQLSEKERKQLWEHQRESEIIARRDSTSKEKDKQPEFKDRQLERAIEYLRSQIKVADKVAAKNAG